MLDVAIVGGGLCGLAAARELHAQGARFGVFEARLRWGGRILSAPCAATGGAVDLGPTWFWPTTEPRIAALARELGLATFPQHDSGRVLKLEDPNKPAEPLEVDGVHGGAQRFVGGAVQLVQALVDRLPAEAMFLGHALTALLDRGDHIELHFRCGDAERTVPARRVVLALPPRLLDEHVFFGPALDTETAQALRGTPTWMAAQAKVVVGYERPFWREDGLSGNAFVSHSQVVLHEIFDACDAAAARGALGGFFALPPELRASIRFSMPMLISSQFVQVFGPAAEGGEQHLQDWATEPHTCSALDRSAPAEQPMSGNVLLRRAAWNGKLHFGASETASYAGGHMEGALEAAARITRALAGATQAAPSARSAGNDGNAPADSNAQAVARLATWVAAQRAQAGERYRRHLNRLLAAQHKEQLTQRAVLDTVEQIYSEALGELDRLALDSRAAGAENGRSNLTPQVLAPFAGFSKALLDEALQFNRESCAISNFPVDHDPDRDYVDTIARDLAAAWREFALNVNALLLAKRAPHEAAA
jgi:monoamine oxidase